MTLVALGTSQLARTIPATKIPFFLAIGEAQIAQVSNASGAREGIVGVAGIAQIREGRQTNVGGVRIDHHQLTSPPLFGATGDAKVTTDTAAGGGDTPTAQAVRVHDAGPPKFPRNRLIRHIHAVLADFCILGLAAV